MKDDPAPSAQRLHRERRSLLRRISSFLDGPMTILSFVWLVLMIVEFTRGLSPALETTNYLIWGAFVLHFLLEIWIAPDKVSYLRTNWLTAIALMLPGLRLLRVFRAAPLLRTIRVTRGVRLMRWVTSLNRGMKATQRTMKQRGLRYVLALTLLANVAGAAGIYFFENPIALRESGHLAQGETSVGISSYGEALWWTAMMLTTMGSDYFPKSTEGRIVALLLAIYAFAIFGYITATVASLIIRVDQQQSRDESLATQITALRREVAQLRTAVATDGERP